MKTVLTPAESMVVNGGERSNAAFRTQSAARQTSLAPHGSKARLQTETTRRRFMAKPCTPRPIAQRVQFFKIKTANVRGRGGRPLVLSLGGVRGPFSFTKENGPFDTLPCAAQGNDAAPCAAILPFGTKDSVAALFRPFLGWVTAIMRTHQGEVCHGHLHRKRLRV